MHHNNKMQKRLELKQKKLDAGLVSERFPNVSGMEIKMTYFQRTMYSDSDKLLMLRTITVVPDSAAYFHMQCMTKECEHTYNLLRTINGLVKNKKKKASGKIYCSGKENGLKANHACMDYEITVKYNNKRKKAKSA